MRKFLFFIGFIPVFLISCSDFTALQIPESVSVKTAATFELPAGDSTISLHEKLSVTKLQEILDDNIGEDSPKPTIYDYNPGAKSDSEATLQYIIDYPLKEFSLSVADTDSDIDEISFSTSIDLDIQSRVADTFFIENGEGDFLIADSGDQREYSISGVSLPLKTELDFKTVVLSEGMLFIEIFRPDNLPTPAGFSFTPKVSLYSGSTLIASESKDCTIGNVIEFDLAGKTLNSSGLRVEIGGTYKDTDGITASEPYEYHYLVGVGQMSVAKITGLNISADEIGEISLSDTKSITGLNSYLESAKIGSGTLSFGCELPSGWSGITCEESNFAVTQVTAGGIDIENEDFKNQNRAGYVIDKKVDLSGQSINTSDIAINGTAKFSLSNATITFSDSNNSLTLSGTCKIDELAEVTIKLSKILGSYEDSIDTGINFSDMLSSFLENDENLIDNVKFSGIRGYAFISQPTKNETLSGLSADVSISAGATTLIPEGTSVTMKSPSETESLKTLASLANSNKLITTDWESDTDFYSAKVTDGALDSIINEHPEGLKFKYTLSFSSDSGSDTLTLTSDDISALKNDSSIKISIAVVLPFVMIFDDVSDGNTSDEIITIDDFLKVLGNEFEEDILHRDEDDDDWYDEDKDKYVDLIESISFNYTLTNTTPFNGEKVGDTENPTIKLTIYDDGGILKTTDDNGNETPGRSLETTSGTHSLSFTPSEIKDILKANSFIPKVKIEISGADGTTAREFKRNAAFGLQGSISLKTNGTVELWNKNK